ncbi:lasso peptide biosynthesis B2 protein [bacterium]|nr:MAG: lasso peptide biosynthesis B2 protein [bacterium]
MPWKRNLRKLRALNWQERALLLSAFFWLGVMRLALWLLPFHRVAARLGLTQIKTFNTQPNAHGAEAARVGWAIKSTAARTPWPSTCLVQALAGMILLRRRKIAAALYLGVAKDENAPEHITAHAWLRSGDLFLTGESGREHYKAVAIFSSQLEHGAQANIMRKVFPRSRPGAEAPDGSELCLSCGLCCSGALHVHAKITPDEMDHARALGLTVEPFKDHLRFHLPCPLYIDNRCSIYTARRPHICGEYQCELLKKYLAGTIPREHGGQIIRRTRELLAVVLAQMPAGNSFSDLQRAMERDWDAGRGPFGSVELRRANAGFLLALGSLEIYSRKHFGKPKAVT